MSELREELYSLLVPLAGERLIVPRACVAEVIGYQAPAEMTNAPPWYVGRRELERAQRAGGVLRGCVRADRCRAFRARTRIVIFHAAGGKLQAGYFGMLTQGFPQLVRVNADVVRPDPSRSFPERSPIICQVRMVNETPLIPDLERLEQMIAEETSVMQ